MIGLWRRWRRRRRCFHHDHVTGKTWIESQLIDLVRRKMFWCTDCDKTWIF